jgi:hypothetical protein
MLTYLSMPGADKYCIPMFSWTNLFLAVIRLSSKVIFNPTKHKTWVSSWHENENMKMKIHENEMKKWKNEMKWNVVHENEAIG